LEPTAESGLQCVKTLTIEHALVGSVCPYCGVTCKHIREHTKACRERRKNIEIDSKMPSERWATHPILGKVMFIRRHEGLCLIEGDSGRYVVPIASLKTGQLSAALQAIEDIDLAPEEIAHLINTLRIKAKSLGKLPRYPELWPGCEVEIQMGDTVRQATIQYKRGPLYYAIVNDNDVGVNISNKEVLKLL